ncbi:hypothetical protein [Klebsiella pneumoniae]
MSQFPNRAALWLNKLAPDAPLMSGLCPSVQVADGQINGENVRFIAVVPDANNHYPRAAGGEVGLLDINNPDAPDDHDLSLVSNTLRDAIDDARTDASLKCRLGAENRRSSQLVRDRMRASW